MSAGTRHLALGDEPLGRRRTCTSSRCGCCPTPSGSTPGYEQLDINAELDRGGLHPIASGQGHDAAISLRQRDAVLWGGRLQPGETVAVPDGRNVHLFVAAGGGRPRGRRRAGDGRRGAPHRAGSPTLTAGADGRRGAHLGDRVTAPA